MSVEIIQERLTSYMCKSTLEEEQALREITQEIILAGLGRTDFFNQVGFQGGTCLRIFHSLNRFSEDMDFALDAPDSTFQLSPYLERVRQEVMAYGYQLEVDDRSKAGTTVRKAFVKDDSVGKLLHLNYRPRTGPMRKLRIKLEVDTNPPLGASYEMPALDFPFPSAVRILTPRHDHGARLDESPPGRAAFRQATRTAFIGALDTRVLPPAVLQAQRIGTRCYEGSALRGLWNVGGQENLSIQKFCKIVSALTRLSPTPCHDRKPLFNRGLGMSTNTDPHEGHFSCVAWQTQRNDRHLYWAAEARSEASYTGAKPVRLLVRFPLALEFGAFELEFGAQAFVLFLKLG